MLILIILLDMEHILGTMLDIFLIIIFFTEQSPKPYIK